MSEQIDLTPAIVDAFTFGVGDFIIDNLKKRFSRDVSFNDVLGSKWRRLQALRKVGLSITVLSIPTAWWEQSWQRMDKLIWLRRPRYLWFFDQTKKDHFGRDIWRLRSKYVDEEKMEDIRNLLLERKAPHR